MISFKLHLLYLGDVDSISIECELSDVIQRNCKLIYMCHNNIFLFVPEFRRRGSNKSISTTVTNATPRVNKLCFRCFEMVSAKRQEKVVTRFPLHSTGPGLYFLSGGRIISMRVLTGFGRPDQCLAEAREKLSDSLFSQYSHLGSKSTAVETSPLNKQIQTFRINVLTNSCMYSK